MTSGDHITPAQAIEILTAKGIRVAQTDGELVADFGHDLINLTVSICPEGVLKEEIDFVAMVRVIPA